MRAAYRVLRYGRKYRSLRYARHYHTWKSFEDRDGNLLAVLREIVPLEGKVVADIGTGTGGIALRVARYARHAVGIDPAGGMIARARCEARARDVGNVEFLRGTAQELPLPKNSVDVAVYGWCVTSVLTRRREGDRRTLLVALLREAERIVRRNGVIAIIETVNVRNELPWGSVYHPLRREFLRELEQEFGFSKRLFANDWDFRTPKNLKLYGSFMLDKEIVRSMIAEGSTVLPECAGIWWRTVPFLRGRSAEGFRRWRGRRACPAPTSCGRASDGSTHPVGK